ncbi:MAG: hypothetical protein ABI220_05950 [Candidatus Saccharimonadales bacterium]
MELWHIYRLCRFAKHNADTPASSLLAEYRTHYSLSKEQANNDWDSAWGEYINGDMHLTSAGRKLVEMRGYGFISAIIREYGGPIVLLAGIASIINLIVIIVT